MLIALCEKSYNLNGRVLNIIAVSYPINNVDS